MYKINQLLFFDAEWVPIVNTYNELNQKFPDLYKVWEHRVSKWNTGRINEGKSELSAESYWERDKGNYPEFIKMICISYGYLNKNNELKLNSFYGNNEKNILETFNKLLVSVKNKGFILSGYAIKRYDMPYIAKRMMINNISPSSLLNVYGQKPWDVNVFDLPEVWAQGQRAESYTPFEWACVVNGIESSKNDISGADVKNVYWNEGNNGLERIKMYCEHDVKSTYLLAKKLIGFQ